VASGLGPAGTYELLEAAARGRIGVDRRFLQSILDRGATAAAADALRFSRAPQDEFPINLDPLLIDLFRHFQTPEAVEFYMDAIRRAPEDVDDSLIQALLPYGEKAIGPLLALYEDLGEEQGSDVAFLLAGLRVRDPRVLQLLLDRLEYDAADGAFCLGLYGDASARPALEKMLAEVPESEADLRREIDYALEQLTAPEPKYEPEPFDLFAEYSERELPPFDVLEESERVEMLSSEDPDLRAGAAHSFFNQNLDAPVRKALWQLAQSDAEAKVRAEAWASLGDATETAEIRDAMIAVLNDETKPVEERCGAALGLYAVAERDDVRQGLEALYAMGGKARVKALEAMWRSLWEPYAKYFAAHLDETKPENKSLDLLKQALRGAGYFRLTAHADKIARFFDRDEPYDELREDALFAYALAMPGETTRGRIKGMLRKIDGITKLTPSESELVMFALDERLRLHGLAPVFEAEKEDAHDHGEHGHSHGPAPPSPGPEPPAAKAGRNDPCPCGSGKKYKKCHGA
jgi:SEC-C motif-containing protein